MSFYKMASLNPFSSWVSAEMISEVRIDGYYYDYKFIELEKKLKMTDFEIVCLGDLFNVITDGDHEKRDYVLEGIPFYTVRDIEEFQINDNNDLFISEADHVRLKRSKLEPNNLLITKTGRVGTTAVVPRMKKKGNISADVAILKSAKKAMDEHYLGTYLNSRYGQLAILRLNYGSTRPRITLKDIPKVQVLVPSIEIQKYIGDKVRRAEELREEAITLQKDIDILLDVDMLLEETDRINNIFHSKVNWTNEINIVDRIDPNFYQKKYRTTIEKLGDNKVELGELVKISKRRYQTGDINKYIEISSINNSFGTIDEVEELRPEEIPTSAKHQVKEGDILVSLVRPTMKAISIVTKEYDNAICTGGFAVLQSKGKVPVEFLTAVLRTNFAGIQFERYCTGSTYPTINENDVVKIFIPQYSEKQINKITEKYRRIIESIYRSKKLIQEAKQDVEDLIEGNFEMSKLNNDSSTESRC